MGERRNKECRSRPRNEACSNLLSVDLSVSAQQGDFVLMWSSLGFSPPPPTASACVALCSSTFSPSPPLSLSLRYFAVLPLREKKRFCLLFWADPFSQLLAFHVIYISCIRKVEPPYNVLRIFYSRERAVMCGCVAVCMSSVRDPS